MVPRRRTLPPLKIGDLGDQSYSLHILSLFITNFDLNTYAGIKIGDFGDPSYLPNHTQHAFRVSTNVEITSYPGLKIGDFGDKVDPPRSCNVSWPKNR